LFLLLHHRRRYRVYDIIEAFIEKIWDQLVLADFKKTKTGVIRCFTNTRFAAGTLREYGLLKYTDEEAYKTWVLSLPGFLVASRLLEQASWDLPAVAGDVGRSLAPEIREAWTGLKTYDDFVNLLSGICEPNVDVFDTFRGVLHLAYELLGDYWQVLAAGSGSRREEIDATRAKLAEIAAQPDIEHFYQELSACVNVERLVQQIE